MTREWKPGDVALVRDESGVERVAVRARHHWAYDETGIGRILADVRPLVVIDPENLEQVERLWRLIDATLDNVDSDQWAVDTVQAALREFANPKPPKLDEPQGLGAVVEDADGFHYTRFSDSEAYKQGDWINKDGVQVQWSSLDAVRVLSEGVAP